MLLVLRIQEAAQYTSIAFGNRCREMGVRPCMATVGDTYDNTMAESFFASLKCDLIAPQTKTEARLSVFTWIKTWRTPWRRHSGLGPMSPINFEMKEQGKQHNPATTTPTLITPDSIQEKDGDREVKCVRGNGATPAWCLVLFK